MSSLKPSYSLILMTLVCCGPSGVAGEILVENCTASFANPVTLSTERPGILADVPREGVVIAPDQVVVRLKDDVAVANLNFAEARAESEIDIALAEKTALAKAAEYDAAVKANTYSGNNAYPTTQLTRLRLDAEAAKLEIEKARHERRLNQLAAEQARAELTSYRLVAKHGGIVTKIFKRAGEGVQLGESIVQVVNTDVIRIEGNVRAIDVEKIRVGMPVRVTFQIPGDNSMEPSKPYMGTLGYIDVSVQEITENVQVWAEIDNTTDRLRERLAATMVILTE